MKNNTKRYVEMIKAPRSIISDAKELGEKMDAFKSLNIIFKDKRKNPKLYKVIKVEVHLENEDDIVNNLVTITRTICHI